MKQKYRDSLNFLGLAMTSFALWQSGVFKGWAYWVIFASICIFFGNAIYELFSKET